MIEKLVEIIKGDMALIQKTESSGKFLNFWKVWDSNDMIDSNIECYVESLKDMI